MIGYLQKFNNLPQDLKDKVSSPETMKSIDELEKQYNVNLATVIMKVMVKEIEIEDLPQFFVFEYKFDNIKANDLVDDLKRKVFFQANDYLGIQEDPKKTEAEANEWLEQRKEDISGRTSEFFFSPEDEEEIKNLTKKFSLPKQEEAKNKTQEKLEAIIKTADLNFSSENLEKRFEKILDTYLRGVRTRVDVKHALMKNIGVGGMGMTGDEAEKILRIAEKYKPDKGVQDIKSPPRIRLIEDKALDISEIPEDIYIDSEEVSKEEENSLADDQIRDVGYDFSKLSSQDEEKKANKEETKLLDDGDDMLLEEGEEENKPPEIKEEVSGVEQKEEIKVNTIKQPEKKTDETQIPVAEKKKEPEKKPTINMAESRRMAKSDGKLKMEDVKYVPKLLGPIDELREMDLVNFRRLAQIPAEIAEKIKEKLGFLEEESYKQRVAGIKAWRESPVNKLYLTIGQESIVNNKSVETIISERQNEGKDYLTNQEFEAIMTLNKDLRF